MSTFISTDSNGAVIPSATRPATVTDIFTTAVSTTDVITGMYGFAQKAGLVVLGMSINAKRLRGSLNPFVRA